MSESPAPALTLYCANHPATETTLRCNRCEKPICPRCAVLTPTGYRCKECVRGQQKVFDTAEWYDYPAAFFISAFIIFLGSLLIPVIGFFSIFLAPAAGMAAAEIVRRVVNKRRSKRLFQMAALGAICGSLYAFLPALLYLVSGSPMGMLWAALWPAVYAFIAASTVFSRLGGIQIR